jgi:hypothetical protein
MQLLDDVLLGNTVGTDAIAPWNANLEPTQGIIPQLDANRLTGIGGTQIYAQSLTLDNSDNIILPDASPTLMAKALTTDSNTSLPDSSVDLLTGQAMSEVYEDLSKFAAEPDFVTKMNLAFGENWDAAGAKALAEGWFNRDFSAIPPVKVVSSAEIGGANGAFAVATDTIYLSKEFLAENAMNPATVADVLLEEIGHSVDARLNVTDSQGDEGAIFGVVVQGKELSEGELQGLRSKDDRASILLGGANTTIEMNQQRWTLNSYVDWRNQNFNWGQPNNISYENGYRSDGKDGIYRNWRKGSPFDPPNTDIVNPLDYFATSGSTQANFEAGKTYKFRVSADDAMIMGVGQSGQPFHWLTLNQARQPEWQTFPYGIFKEYSWTPTQSGSYSVNFWHLEQTGDADLNISWEKTGQAQSSSVPAGFTSVKSAKGVNLYESADKSYYVQAVDLSQGASLTLRTGEQEYNSQTNGANGGTSPKFKRESIDTLWRNFSDRSSNPFSVVNGAFFSKFEPYTQLSDPLKITYPLFDGTESVVFDGTESRGDIDLKLEIGNDRADITEFDGDLNSIKNSAYPLVLVGLKENIGENDPIGFIKGRTLVGVRDGDSNGTNETVLILTSKGQPIQDAARMLKNFGANKIIQFDGSGSSQLIAQGQKYLNGDDRPIPQFIGVLSAA